MLILTGIAAVETAAKNSRFLTEAVPVATPDAARAVWRDRKQRYDNGGHIVYAFVTGPDGGIMGCSDDGEPSGTAGRPMLTVLKNSGITNCVITTARWFGGVKLGTGGLVRAYTACARSVLEAANTREFAEMVELAFAVAYPECERLKRGLAEMEFELTNEEFAGEVRIAGRIRADRVEALEKRIGGISFRRVEQEKNSNFPQNRTAEV